MSIPNLKNEAFMTATRVYTSSGAPLEALSYFITTGFENYESKYQGCFGFFAKLGQPSQRQDQMELVRIIHDVLKQNGQNGKDASARQEAFREMKNCNLTVYGKRVDFDKNNQVALGLMIYLIKSIYNEPGQKSQFLKELFHCMGYNETTNEANFNKFQDDQRLGEIEVQCVGAFATLAEKLAEKRNEVATTHYLSSDSVSQLSDRSDVALLPLGSNKLDMTNAALAAISRQLEGPADQARQMLNKVMQPT